MVSFFFLLMRNFHRKITKGFWAAAELGDGERSLRHPEK